MILKLQQTIYNHLNQKKFTDQLKGIYYQVPSNSSFPYIYIGDFNAKDISTKDRQLAEITFKINIYLRDKNLRVMLELSSEIAQELKT
jgi:hypothetical protein